MEVSQEWKWVESLNRPQTTRGDHKIYKNKKNFNRMHTNLSNSRNTAHMDEIHYSAISCFVSRENNHKNKRWQNTTNQTPLLSLLRALKKEGMLVYYNNILFLISRVC